MTYTSTVAIPPGSTLLEILEKSKMSQKELSDRIGITEKHISQIINGKSPITPETAIKLEKVFGGSAGFWNNLEKNYQETRARLANEKTLAKEVSLVKKFTCYNQLVEYGCVKKTRNPREKVKNLLKFFRIDSLRFLFKVYSLDSEIIAYRKAITRDISKENLAAWLRWGEIESEKIDIGEFNKAKLKEKIPILKKLTYAKVSNVDQKMQKICAECGVAVVYIPCLKNTRVNGATRFRKDKAVIQLSDRLKWGDVFWFTFFHELGHIIKHGKKERFIEFSYNKSKVEKEEREADEFAMNALIPKTSYRNFINKNNFSDQSIIKFAKAIDVHPSIVAGRLAHEGILDWKDIKRFRFQVKITL